MNFKFHSFLERKHSKEEALYCIQQSNEIFEKNSIDLIFGTPSHKISSKKWFENLEYLLKMNLSHISLYQLTIEKRTKSSFF
jgi:coproporphyrinogen III oxidase-like Fe-S oxidoreductase